ncbi:MAG: N-acyl-D-amino-acid deacylase family protein [Gaiellaceae bacterium]
MLDGGLVVDGTGRKAFAADVGIRNDRIEAVGDLGAAEARERIDVTGSTIAPGFIDVHTHSDLAPLLADEHLDLRLASLRQGVTTEICGNCGFSVFPASEERDDDVLRYLQSVLGPNARSFADLPEFRQALTSGGLVTNLGTLVGHGTLRAGVIGFANRAADDAEMRDLTAALRNACEQGALGFSSGLIYTPGAYAPIEELVELAKVAAVHDLPYVTHMRDEMDGIDDAIDEALRIGAESGAAVQISHHKTAGKRNWGHTALTLARIERARAEGIDVAIDVYPYTAGSTVLAALLPPWAGEGGIAQLLERLASEPALDRIRTDFEHGLPGWQKLVEPDGWGDVVVAGSPRHPEFEGRSIADLAASNGVDAVSFTAELLLAEQAQVTVVLHMMAEEDVARVIASPLSMIGSDGIPLPGKQHPRWAGSFARIVGKYVRQDGLLTLEEAVHKMTQLPAERFKLRGKGVVAPGMDADLVVFDFDHIADGATYADPLTPPAGIVHVLVNGELGIRDGVATGTRAGTFVIA